MCVCMLSCFSCVRLCATLWTVAPQAPLSMGILQARIVECIALLQGMFPIQGSNPGLPHCRQILYLSPGKTNKLYQFSSVAQSCLILCDPMNCSQASLSITNSWSLPKFTSIESVMPSSHLLLCRPFFLLPQSLPASESFPMSQLFA